MKAIILAAGRGSRLGGLTDDIPKPMMDVGGEPLISKQIRAYRAHGVEVSVVRGYLADQLRLDGARAFDNAEWETTGLLTSLFRAEEAMAGGFMISYGDTMFRPEHVGLVLEALKDAPAAAAVDTAWRSRYEGRDWHPPSEAELVRVNADGRILDAGKWVSEQTPGDPSILGELTGLLAVGPDAAAMWREVYHARGDAPYRTEARDYPARTAYTSNHLSLLIREHDLHVQAVGVPGGYWEIDTPEDLELARQHATW